MDNSHILLKLQQNLSASKLIGNNSLQEKYMSKINKEGNQNKVHEVRTTGNIKYEPILRM